MRRAIPAVLIVLSILAVTARDAEARTVTVPEYREALEHAFQYRSTGGDFRAFAGRSHHRARLARWRTQAHGPVARGYMRRLTRERVAQWRFHRRIDVATPYGPYAIPGYIVACESHGNWGAYNPSGAAGIYQIMPMHGRPWPADSPEDMAAHHLIAANLWNGGAGASNWVCA